MGLKTKLLTSDHPLLGSFIGIPSPPLIEMLGHAGYDFVVLDAEHGAFSEESIEDCLRAAMAVNVPCIVRIAELEAKLIQYALDSGADGIQVPCIETPSQANMVVQFSHFPPVGKRGYGSTTRAAAFGFRPRPQVRDAAQRELIVNIQIESKAGVENLPAILETKGVDVVFIGTSDLSMDYGYESPGDSAMMPLLEKVISAIVSIGKIAGIHVSDWSKIDHLQQLGVKYFTVSAPLVIKDAFTNQVQDFAARVKRSR
ncbi:HpcH/HpaI aldolase/citrate lyase family protein [Chloroflexota bacterium]